MSEPKFKRGDLVRHRASAELAVVVAAHAIHDGEPRYELNPGFWDPNLYETPEYLLERVERVRQFNQDGELSEVVVPADEPVMPLRREAESG